MESSAPPVTVAVIGAGPRALEYAGLIRDRRLPLKITAIADPDRGRRESLAAAHGVPSDRLFDSFEALAATPGLADAAINTTADALHWQSTRALVAGGYHVLLEKPIAPNEQQIVDLIEQARLHRRIVMICHGLRYQPKLVKARQLVGAGVIGRVLSIQATEEVSYHHAATTLIRHPRNGPNNTPLLLYKSCHDLDLICWMLPDAKPRRVSSAVTESQYRPEFAPAGSTAWCNQGCAVEQTCAYSARRLYVENQAWESTIWIKTPHATNAQKLQLLSEPNPFGRCIWRCSHNAVAHQNVLIEFNNGVTATFDFLVGSARGSRSLQVFGTQGELELNARNQLLLRTPAKNLPSQLNLPPGFDEQEIDVPIDPADAGPRMVERLMLEDFAAAVRGDPHVNIHSRIDDSLAGHQIAFAAEQSRRQGITVDIAS